MKSDKTSVLSFAYSEKIKSSLVARRQERDYFYVVNNIKHTPSGSEEQFFEYYDYWYFVDEALSRVKDKFKSLSEDIIGKDGSPVYRSMVGYFLPICARCLYLDHVKREIVNRGYSSVMVVDKYFRRNRHLFDMDSKDKKAVFELIHGLRIIILSSLKTLFLFFQNGRRVNDVEVIIGMHNAKQAFDNYTHLLRRMKGYAIWLFDRRPPIPEIRSLSKKYIKMNIAPRNIFNILGFALRTLLLGLQNGTMPPSLKYLLLERIIAYRIANTSYKDTLKKVPDLKIICGSFEAGADTPLLYEASERRGVKLINLNHGCTGVRDDRWKRNRFHFDILMGEGWKKSVDRLNTNRNLNLGSIDLDQISFRENKELARIKENYKLMTLIGTYFAEQFTVESCLNHKTIMAMVRDALLKRPDWFLLVRPRLKTDQYNILIDEVFVDFPKDRLLVDIAHEGKFSLAEVLSYSDCCVTGASSAVFECIKANLPTIVMNFDPCEFYYQELVDKGMVLLITHENKNQFLSLFDPHHSQIEQWLNANKPQNKNWNYFIRHDENETSSERIARFLESNIG